MEKLIKYLFNFEGKQTIEINYAYGHSVPIELLPYEDFPVQNAVIYLFYWFNRHEIFELFSIYSIFLNYNNFF